MDWNSLTDKSFWHDQQRIIFNRDCHAMVDLPDETVQVVVTSPPYWGLRKYSGEQELVWDGDECCEHQWDKVKGKSQSGGSGKHTTGGPPSEGLFFESNNQFCSLCGAWKGAFGLEPTPEMYVQHTVEILREIRRVLRSDGVCFWNIGDSYNGSGGAGGDYNKGGLKEGKPKYPGRQVSTLKPKDLCLIPFRIAIAVQEDGWWVRSVIIWNKPNPMPESVTDRPTESHEYILMLTKSAKYYWDMEAVREQQSQSQAAIERYKYAPDKSIKKRGADDGCPDNVWSDYYINPAGGRNLRTVWTFPTRPYPEAHFAVFPEKLPETCIKAASKESDIVLDPFAGAGTTLKVAANLNRRAIGYELSKEYCRLIIDRNKQSVMKLEC